MIVYLNGEYLPIEQAKVSVMDRGFLLADGIYDVIPAYHGKLFGAKEHLHRLRHSLEMIHLNSGLSNKDILTIADQLIDKNPKAAMQTFYIQVTRGVSSKRTHHYSEKYIPTIFAKVAPVELHDLSTGIKAITVEDPRWKYCDIKSINRLANVLLIQQAHLAHAEEALIIGNGLVTEGASSSLFIVEKDTIITPPLSHHILGGVTRKLIAQMLAGKNLLIEEDISEERLRQADEIWITSSSRGIAPVTTLDQQPVGTGKPGVMYQKINALYEQFIQDFIDHYGKQ